MQAQPRMIKVSKGLGRLTKSYDVAPYQVEVVRTERRLATAFVPAAP
jgi:hypothetical protein